MYEEKIQNLILNQLSLNRISLIDAASIVYVLSLTKNEEQMKKVISVLQQDYPQLNEILDKEKTQIKENLEEIVSKFVQKIIFDNPLLATQISQATMNKAMTLEKLKQEFPTFEQYLKTI
jgi:endonuclease III